MDASSTFATTPSNRWLGLRLLQRSPDLARVEMPVRAEFLQEAGVVQGGILTALADTTAVWLLWPDLATDHTMTGSGCSMHFLGGATLDGGPLLAEAVPLRRGRTLSVCESTVHQGDRLVAKGTFTFLVRQRRTS
ncbi:MAG: PaaI family thioesterase [Planctomycetes bacterium]|nr:PaaI family thioesterase [Planctomycetota bacterium]